MQIPTNQQPQPKSSAGYRPLISGDFTKGVGSPAYGYVAGAAGLGLLVGVIFAITAGQTKVATVPQISASLSTHTSGLSTLPAVYAGPGPSLLSQVGHQKKDLAGSVRLSPVKAKSPTSLARARKRRRIHKLFDWKSSGSHKTAKRRPYISPNPPSAPDEPSALQLATAAAAAGPFFLGIQGDATVANYDATSGTIQTYEGETYILAKAASESNAISWQDYPINVHYRCDETGNCTLFHGGASAAAKLTR
jgi:hypothetical protein